MTDTGFVQYKADEIKPHKFRHPDVVLPYQSIPSTAYNATSTQETGFVEYKSSDMETQKKYDAYSPYWEGEASTNKAIASGIFDIHNAEKNRQAVRTKKTETPVPAESSWNCIIQ